MQLERRGEANSPSTFMFTISDKLLMLTTQACASNVYWSNKQLFMQVIIYCAHMH